MTTKSDRIERLMEDPDLKEAFNSVRMAIHNGWAATKPSEPELREEWHRRLFTLQSVEENLYRAIQDGKLEDYRAAEQEKLAPLGDIKLWRHRKNKG